MANIQSHVIQSRQMSSIEMTGLVPQIYDYVTITYTGTNPTTIVYKKGGAIGQIVATLAITYDGNNNPLTITRT